MPCGPKDLSGVSLFLSWRDTPSADMSRLVKTTTKPTLDWLEKYLAGHTDVETGPAVEVDIIGTSLPQWLELPRWPPAATPLKLYLGKDGILREQRPSNDTKASRFTFDPLDPTPTLGGPLLVGGGFLDDTSPAARTDVLAFTTKSLPKPMRIIGKVSVELTHATECPRVDLCIRLSVVNKQGVSQNITQQYLRLDGIGGAKPILITLLDTAYLLDSGDRASHHWGRVTSDVFSQSWGRGSRDRQDNSHRHSYYLQRRARHFIIIPVA